MDNGTGVGNPDRKYRILVVDLAFIGDLLMSTPALANLRRAYPKALIDILVSENSRPMIRHNPDIDRVFTTDLKMGGFDKLRGQAAQVRERGYDLAISLHRGHGTLMMLKLAEIPKCIGFTNGGRCWFLTGGIPFKIRKHRSWNHMNLLDKALGISIDYTTPTRLELDFEAANLIDTTLRQRMSLKKIAIINPNASWPTRRWLPERFAKVGDFLACEGYQVILIGSPGEKPICAKVRSFMEKDPIDLTGETTLFELGALISRSEILITNDTGPMHMGQALGTKLVSIFGASDPARTGPWMSETEPIQADIDCIKCYRKRCWHLTCMRKVTAEEVIGRVRDCISNGT